MNKNDFIKWTSVDNEGEFEHSGRVESVSANMIYLETDHGLMGIPKTDGNFESIEPFEIKRNDPMSKKNATAKTANKSEKKAAAPKKVVAKKEGVSKADQALEIVRQNPKAARKELIQMFVDQLGMSIAGASTYVYNAKKKLAEQVEQAA